MPQTNKLHRSSLIDQSYCYVQIRQNTILLCYGYLITFELDPISWGWLVHGEMIICDTKVGKKFVNDKVKLTKTIFEKWLSILPRSFKLEWNDVSLQTCVKKDFEFVWAMWHKILVVNTRCANVGDGTLAIALHVKWEH